MTSASTARSSGMPATANAGGQRRVRVHDRLHVRAQLVHRQVHLQLGRGVALARELLARQVGDDQHVRGHEPLRHAGRRREDALVVEADADVAVVAGDVAAVVQPAADLDDVARGACSSRVMRCATRRARHATCSRHSRSRTSAVCPPADGRQRLAPSRRTCRRPGPSRAARPAWTAARRAPRVRRRPGDAVDQTARRTARPAAATSSERGRRGAARTAASSLTRDAGVSSCRARPAPRARPCRRAPGARPSCESSACLAARPSALSGASAITCCHASAAPLQVLLAERAHDAHVQQRLGVLRRRSSATARTARSRGRAGSM